MSVVSGLIDTSCVFKYKKKIVPTNSFNGMNGEVDPIIMPMGAGMVGSASKFKTYTPAFLNAANNPVQFLKYGAEEQFYTAPQACGINQHLPEAINNGDPTTRSSKYEEYIERMNETPPLRMYNGVEFKIPAGFISR